MSVPEIRILPLTTIIAVAILSYLLLRVLLRRLESRLGRTYTSILSAGGQLAILLLALAAILIELRLSEWAILVLDGVRILLIVIAAALAYRGLGHLARHLEFLIQDTEDQVPIEHQKRVRTLEAAIQGVGLVVIGLIAGMMVLSELGLDIGPLIAGAGLLGLAVGFGAQTLVRDVISGFFILIENQFRVEDWIQVGQVSGKVEKMTLRATFLRDLDGTLHVVPNGEIRILSNRSKQWSRAVVDVRIAYEADTDQALAALSRAGQAVYDDPELRPLLLEVPRVTGVEALGDVGMTLRMIAQTWPGKQWTVARALRKEIKETLAAEGIAIK